MNSAIDPNLCLFEVYDETSSRRWSAPQGRSLESLFTPALDPNLMLFEISPLYFRLTAYAGPLDLLLDLIKRNEMDVYNIPISEITRQYLDSLASMKALDLEVAGEFLVMAATLLYIKSRMLLPIDDEEDEGDELDPRSALVQKLLEYQAFKEAAKELGLMEGERAKTFTRQISDYYLSDLDPEDAGIDTFSADLYDLLSAFQKVLARAKTVEPHNVFEEEVTIEQKIDDLKLKIEKSKRVFFSQLFDASWTRNLLVVTFLAMLELIRMKFVYIKQDDSFGEILIEKRDEVPVIS